MNNRKVDMDLYSALKVGAGLGFGFLATVASLIVLLQQAEKLEVRWKSSADSSKETAAKTKTRDQKG